MIQAIRPIGQDYDSEYLRIMRELKKLGLTPSGNKQIDKTRLSKAKQAFVDKLQDEYVKERRDQNSGIVQSSLEEERPGAMALAELNKILLGI